MHPFQALNSAVIQEIGKAESALVVEPATRQELVFTVLEIKERVLGYSELLSGRRKRQYLLTFPSFAT